MNSFQVPNAGYSSSHDLLETENPVEDEDDDSAFPLALKPDSFSTIHFVNKSDGNSNIVVPQIQRNKLRMIEKLGEGKFGMVIFLMFFLRLSTGYLGFFFFKMS